MTEDSSMSARRLEVWNIDPEQQRPESPEVNTTEDSSCSTDGFKIYGRCKVRTSYECSTSSLSIKSDGSRRRVVDVKENSSRMKREKITTTQEFFVGGGVEISPSAGWFLIPCLLLLSAFLFLRR